MTVTEPAGAGVGVNEGVTVSVGVLVGSGVEVGMGVSVGIGVSEGVAVLVGVGVIVLVGVGKSVGLGVQVGSRPTSLSVTSMNTHPKNKQQQRVIDTTGSASSITSFCLPVNLRIILMSFSFSGRLH